MNPKALKKADQQVTKAERAFNRLCATSDPDETIDAWDDFLTALGKIYFKLQGATPKNGPSDAWHGRKLKERSDDPLLEYVFQARNSETHGVEDVTQTWVNHNIAIAGDGPFFGINVPEGQSISDLVGILPNGERVPIPTVSSRNVRLTAVHDRKHGNSYELPKTHFGEQLPDVLEPAYVAGMTLNYVKSLIQEAWTRVP